MAKPPLRTDEPLDRCVCRPLARGIVWLLAPTPVTPNQLTIVACVLGTAVGVALGFHQGVIAAALTLGYLAFDCADGQLARLRGGGGYLGRAVDGVGDYITATAMHLGLAAWIAADQGLVTGLAWAVAAGLSMAWASFLLDRYKRRYRGDTDDIEAIQREADETPGLGGWLVARLLPYARSLEAGAQVIDRPLYQERLRLPMLLWLLNGPTMHVAVLAVCGVLGRPIWYAWMAVGPMNVVTVFSLSLQRHLERREPAVLR